MSWFSHGCHGQWLCSWAHTHDDNVDGVAQHGGRTPNIRLTETLQPWFTVYFFDIEQLCYELLTPVKTRNLLTSITWPYRGLKCTGHWDHVFFLKLTVDQVPVSDWIAGSCQVNLLKTGQDCPEIVRRPVNASLGSKFIRIITFSSIQMFFSLLFCFKYMMIIKLKTESRTVNRTPHRTVTTLKSTFYLFLG